MTLLASIGVFMGEMVGGVAQNVAADLLKENTLDRWMDDKVNRDIQCAIRAAYQAAVRDIFRAYQPALAELPAAERELVQARGELLASAKIVDQLLPLTPADAEPWGPDVARLFTDRAAITAELCAALERLGLWADLPGSLQRHLEAQLLNGITFHFVEEGIKRNEKVRDAVFFQQLLALRQNDRAAANQDMARIISALPELPAVRTWRTEVTARLERLSAEHANIIAMLDKFEVYPAQIQRIEELLQVQLVPDAARPAEMMEKFDYKPPPPQLPELIGRAEQLQYLCRKFAEIRDSRRGAFVFVLGEAGSGRAALCRAVIEQLAQVVPLTTALVRFGVQIPAEIDTAEIATQLPHTATALGEHGLALIAQIVRQVPGLHLRDDDAEKVFYQAARRAAQEAPLVLVLQDLEDAQSQWIDWLRRWAREVAHDIPALILITVEAPLPLAQIAKADLSEPLWLARDLTKRGLGETRFLGALTEAEIGAHYGLSPKLAWRLWSLTAGDAFLVHTLWEEWRREGAVSRTKRGAWVIDSRREWLVWGDAKEQAEAQVRELLEGRDAPYTVAQVYDFLRCAAVEGEIFTAPAVAEVFGLDHDEFIDFLDDYLAETEEYWGILREVGHVTVRRYAEEHTLWQYQFTPRYQWHVWGKYSGDAERREWARALATALEQLYTPSPDRAAPTLARLYRAAGEDEAAKDKTRHYQRLLDFAGTVQSLRAQVDIARQMARDLFDWLRVYQLQMELGKKMLRAYPFAETLEVFTAAYLTAACKTKIRVDRAWAMYYMSGTCWQMGDLGKARQWANRSRRLFARLGDRAGLAHTYHNIGLIHDARGDYSAALEWYERSVTLKEEVGDRAGLAATYNNIGLIHKARGEYAAALEWYKKDLAITEEVGDRAGLAATYNNIGLIHDARGDYSAALGWYERSVAIMKEVGDRAGLAVTLHNMGHVALAQEEYARAREYFTRSRDLFAEMGLEDKVAWEEEMIEVVRQRME